MMHIKTLFFLMTLVIGLIINVSVHATQPVNEFSGKIGKTFPDSILGDSLKSAQESEAPNVVMWVIDDLGFGQLGSFGGVIHTPTIDGLAAKGLRYTNYHTTPICSASRASILTGRNPHNVHIGGHSAMAIDFPGQDGLVPRAAGTIAENLHQAGYLTYAIGKWDHLPPNDASPAGPYTYWPSGQGFDHFYGFLSYDADNFEPVLWLDNDPVETPKTADYHLTTDMADKAIAWINMRDGGNTKQPFFLYWATGAVHAPHHAPDSYLQRYRGKFDDGWDDIRTIILARQKKLGIVPEQTQLPPRPEGMPAWQDLSDDQRRMYARMMEAFAAQLDHADAEFGRIVATLKARGELDNTIIIVTSDNGASAEGGIEGMVSEHLMANGMFPSTAENLKFYEQWGGPETYPHYPVGWALAGNTPFRFYKQTAYEGGVHVPLVMHWPKGIDAGGEIRQQFHHVIDVTPTILESAKVKPAAIVNNVKQMPFDGVSMNYSFNHASQKTVRKTQYFEMYGNRGLWHEGWKAVVPHRLKTWNFMTPPLVSDDNWELYNLDEDINETNNLAQREPERLMAMRAKFDREAKRNNVYPLTNTGEAQKVRLKKHIQMLNDRQGIWRYEQAVTRIPEANAPPLHTHSYHITATVDLPENANGVIMARGGRHGGMALYIIDGYPEFFIRNLDLSFEKVTGRQRLKTGRNVIKLDFERLSQGANISLTANDQQVIKGKVTAKLPVWILSNSETFDIGSDTGSAVSNAYNGPFSLNGNIHEVVVDVDE